MVTRPGQDAWDFQFQNFLPRFRFKEGGVRGIDAFTPRLRLAGPIQRGRLWFAETVNYRFVRSRVNELESVGLDRSEQQFESFDALTQVDYVIEPSHRLVGTFVWFPNNIDNLQLDTLHPFDATPDLAQRGWNAAVAERAILGTSTTLDTAFSIKQFDIAIQPKTLASSEITVGGVRQNYFNRFDRDSWRYDGSATLTGDEVRYVGPRDCRIDRRAREPRGGSRPAEAAERRVERGAGPAPGNRPDAARGLPGATRQARAGCRSAARCAEPLERRALLLSRVRGHGATPPGSQRRDQRLVRALQGARKDAPGASWCAVLQSGPPLQSAGRAETTSEVRRSVSLPTAPTDRSG